MEQSRYSKPVQVALLRKTSYINDLVEICKLMLQSNAETTVPPDPKIIVSVAAREHVGVRRSLSSFKCPEFDQSPIPKVSPSQSPVPVPATRALYPRTA